MQDYTPYGLPPRPLDQDINKPIFGDGATYLHELARKNAPPEAIIDAIKHGADVNAADKTGMTPLGIAITRDSFKAVECLLDNGAQLFIRHENGSTFHAVNVAIVAGYNDVFNMLLDRGGGYFVNIPGQAGYSPEQMPSLSMAVRENKGYMLRRLIDAGAFLNTEAGFSKITPLHRAALLSSPFIIEQLVRAGADIDLPQSETGKTALHYAVGGSNNDAVRMLIKLGADIEMETANGYTPLMMCGGHWNGDTVRILLAANAQVNRKSSFGKRETPLHIAAMAGNGDVIAALLRGGANPLLTNIDHETPAMVAERLQRMDVIYYLRSAQTDAELKVSEKNYDDYLRKKAQKKPSAP